MIPTNKIVQIVCLVAAFAFAAAFVIVAPTAPAFAFPSGDGDSDAGGDDNGGDGPEESELDDPTNPPITFARIPALLLSRGADSGKGSGNGGERDVAGLADGVKALPGKAAKPPAKATVKKLKRPLWIKRTFRRRARPRDEGASEVGVAPPPKACPSDLPLTELPPPACRVWLARAAGGSTGVGGVGAGKAGPGGMTAADKLYRAKSYPNLARRSN